MSNALRTALDYAAQDQQQRAVDAEAVAASEMGSLRRGYEAGRIGTDVNANNADIASMRNAGRMQEADALAQQNLALQQRQAMYAPEIARVEDVGSKQGYLRDGVSWFGTQLGQMGASAQDPVALTAAGTAVGKAIGAVPRLSAVGKAIQYGSQAGAFGLNQRQMTGEMYGRLADDPQALANTTPQEAYRTSNLYGLAAGAAESLLPGVVGHSLGGGALRAGAKAATGRGAGMTLLGDTALETGTELGQQYGQQRVHSAYNPTRDTSQDASELLNAAAGGAAGGFGVGAPHAIADSAYGRTARAGELVAEKTGEVVDLAREKGTQAYEDTGIKGVVDLGMQGGKSALDNLGKVGKAAQDYMRDASGKINYAEGIKRAQADVERFKLSQEEADLLTAAPPAEADPDTLASWTEQNYADRTNYVFGKLEALERDGVQEATGFLDALESDDPVTRTQAVDEATSFLLERNTAAQVRERATLFQAAIGEFIQKGAARMTRGAKAAGDAAAFAGLNVAEGVKQGLEGKKNMQGAGFGTLDYDNWKAWRDQNALPLGEDSQRAHSIQKAVEGRTRRKEMKGLVPRPVDPEAAKRSYERATLFGEMLAAEAATRRAKVMGHRADEADGVIDYTNYVRSLAYEVEDMAEGWAARAADPVTKRGPRVRTTDQASVALGLVDSMAEDLSNVLGPVAGDVVARMAQSAEPTAKAFFDVLQERVTNRQVTMAERKVQDQTLQDQMLALLPQEHQSALREDGGAGARSLQQTVQMIARGRVPPAKRQEIEEAIGAGTLNRMLSLYGETVAPETQVGTAVDDAGAAPARAPLESDEAMGDDAETSAWEARMKEKTSERGAGEKRYGVSFSPAMRTDPFEPLKKLSKAELAAFRDEDRQRVAAGDARIYPDVDRPRLFTKGQTNHDGSDAMMKRAEAMAEKLGPEFAISPWRAEGSQPAVEPRSAKSVMDDMGMPTSKRLAIYRDYMNSAATNDKLTAEQRKAAAKHARAAQLALLDAVENPEAWGRQNRNTAELTEEQSATMKTPPGDLERLISRMLERRSKAVQTELDTYGADLANKVYGELDSPEPKKANTARLNAGERGAVHAAMDRYFSERFLVVAERKIDREYSRIDSVELRDMIQRGRKAYDHIKDDQNEVAGANLLWFKSSLADERTGMPGMVPIRANNLVAWVRKQRALGEEFEARDKNSNRDKNEAFLDDLSEGISIVMSSGHVEATMPYMLDKSGAKKSLQKDYPDNLELETSTYGGYKFGRQQQVAKLDDNPDGPRWKDQNIAGPRDPRSVENATDDPKNQKKVAFDQQTADLEDGGGNDAPAIRADKSNEGTLDPYTDIAVKAGLRAKAVPPKQTRAGKRAEQHAVAAAAARRGGKSSDDAEAAGLKNPRVDPGKLDRELLWESGLESDKIRDDEQTTVEKEEVSKRSKNIADGIGPEPKVTAKRFAEDRAGALLEVFRKEGTDAGLAALERRMRTAKETNTNPRAGVVGGAHYAYPLAHVLNPETIGGMDLGTAEAARVVAMRTELAGLVLTSPSLDLADKVVMAKAMAPKASRDRITAANVLKVLSKASETQPAAPEVAATGAPKSQAKPGGVKLNGKTPFTSKDQAKADRATKFIGRGSERSSTAQYAKDFGALANTGSYTAADTVFVSAEGARAGRVEPDFAEIDWAVAAGATIITDNAENRAREYNVGERQVAAHLVKKGYTETSPGTWAAPKRKLNAQGTLQGGVAADMMGSRDIMRTLGFKAAPPQFADVASKLLVSPDVDADTFIKQSAEGISHLLMEGASGEQIRSVLGNDYWAPTRYKVAARLMAGGMQRGDALVASYREMVRMALTKELTTRGIATKTFVGRVTQLARELVSKFRKLTQSEQFADLVRNNLNDLIAKAAGPVDLKANYRKVTFQDAVDADPQAARVLAHMSKLPGTMLTGSIVLAANGPIYRDASNMLHDLDFVVNSRDASTAHLTKAFPDATKVYDFQTSNGKVDTYIVPPPGAKITSIERKGSKVVGFTVVRDGVEIGRTWNDENGEHKTGEPGTFVDFFSGTKDGKAVSTTPFKVDGTAYQIATSPVGAIFNAKLSMGRSKDLTDYLRFAPNVGRKLSLMSTQVHNDLQSLGILGHEYAAANGRNGTTPNYVIYDDSKISTNYVHFNKQEANNFENWKNGPQARAAQGMATDADLKAAREYFDRVLGKQVKAEFENITGYSGEFIEADNLIKVSTLTNAGVMNVARHEALHAFFSKFVKANPKAVKVLSSLTDNERVLRRLQTLLKDEPAALEQLVDGEERLAYIYQFAMAGQLRLPHTPGTTLLHKVRKFLRRVFQMVSDDERAVDLLYAFEHGKMSDPSAGARAMAKVLDQGTWMTKGARSIDAVTQRAAAMVLPANTILAESISPTARALAKQFFTNPGEEGAAEDGKGYLNARNEGMRQYDNLFRKAINKLDKRQLDELTEAMQNETPTGDVRDAEVAAAKEQLHALFERFHRYLTEEKGLHIGKINEGYFPVVYDVDKVREGGLEKLLSGKYIGEINKMTAAINDKRSRGNPDAEMVSSDEVISAIVNHITRDNPLDDAELEPQRQDGVLRPWFASGERRVLDFLSPEDRAQFQEKDIIKTVSRYVRQGVRTAEYSSRFGRTGALLDQQLDKIQMELEAASREMLAAGDLKNEKAREKWVKRQYRDVANAVGGMEGSLGHDISEGVRKINSWAIVYQNVRLLPLALFSSFVDPLGIVARGGEMREAFTTFTEGIKGVARQWSDALREEPADRQKSQWEELAEHAGVIDTATFSHLLADEYGSVYLDGTTKKINEVMFKANGMEAWNRAMRVGATRSAVRFMERHNKAPTEHSARWMKDLGFEPGTLPLDSEGKLITDKRVMMSENPGMEMEEAEAKIAKVHSAINRWVEGAILSPNAAQRPAWGSDPHYSMFWHLKQFAYSFHETIMKRALNEAKHGNVMPLGVFAWYIPTMIAADVTKGLILGAGELPAYMKGYDLGDWMLHGVERSGVLGIGQVAIDGAQDPTGLAGPAVEQITDIFVQPMEQNIVKALPVNALYSRATL